MGRLEEEMQRIREELDALDFYAAPRDVGELFTKEQDEYISEVLAKWTSGESWSPEDVPEGLFPTVTTAGGWEFNYARDFLPALLEMFDEGYFDAELYADEDDDRWRG